jgi:hypothetical protein
LTLPMPWFPMDMESLNHRFGDFQSRLCPSGSSDAFGRRTRSSPRSFDKLFSISLPVNGHPISEKGSDDTPPTFSKSSHCSLWRWMLSAFFQILSVVGLTTRSTLWSRTGRLRRSTSSTSSISSCWLYSSSSTWYVPSWQFSLLVARSLLWGFTRAFLLRDHRFRCRCDVPTKVRWSPSCFERSCA